ncbi:MAG TPA: DUF2059 domain-containing protein [Xanthobacteraceae bacterium]|jgi:hypothetical protein|nr:DUF2059 domain-containing protein [Xanthobacteraceae bacterium]
MLGRLGTGRGVALRLFGFIVLTIAISGAARTQSAAQTPGRELVDQIGIENIMTFPMHRSMLTFMRPLQAVNKSREQEVFEVFDKMVMPQAMLVFTAEPVKNMIAKYYDDNFSILELKELNSFFSTPTGKKFASKGSLLNDGLATLTVRLFATATVQHALRVGVEEIQKRGMVIPKPQTP